jgi:hypothetical protein
MLGRILFQRAPLRVLKIAVVNVEIDSTEGWSCFLQFDTVWLELQLATMVVTRLKFSSRGTKGTSLFIALPFDSNEP